MSSSLTEFAATLHRAASLLQAIDDIAQSDAALSPRLQGICVETARELVVTAHDLLAVAGQPEPPGETGQS